ncbi:proline--tRNA ligase [Paenibacillus antri]|uniref:Proline--tRNA ligase n=1 Tax=Paenibacillus antri TaxID=2582848 RepID=A0A5R9G3Q6_9BACL|nr:proline--tRNA ligase [Paenibacillus antri]TLS49629.1 proline--tRNA ligase [Paenibacillus antri]
MRQSTLFSSTLRESPADADTASHRWLLRAGYIRQLAAGVYSYLPLGLRVLRKLERIVREEMDRAGAQELLMPALQPAELWKASGRYDVYGPELIRLKDRHQREFALGPTHEEVVTELFRNEISSYRRLPVTVYQVQTKYRDERRPRFGLLRGREFLMKDAYSFDMSWEGLDASYRGMYDAYLRIFERCGLRFRAVEADAGAIGGEGGSHEFMALADIGEDTIVACTHCEQAANVERAASGTDRQPAGAAGETTLEKLRTPNARTIEQLSRFLDAEPSRLIKTLVYAADGAPTAVLVRGDHEVNEIKLKRSLGVERLELADAATVEAVTGAPVGFAGPVGLSIPVIVDEAVARMPSGVVGGNEADMHWIGVVPGRDFPVERTGDFRNAAEGEICPHCGEGELRYHRGIEVGHVFKLGTKYSVSGGAVANDADGKEVPVIMGCYGIGVSRLLAAVAEQHRDERGLAWPASIAPFRVHLVPVALRDETQRSLAEAMYATLLRHGVEALLDDRDERAGVKFADSELIGVPVRIVVGKHAAEGNVEWVDRATGERTVVPKDEALARLIGNGTSKG